MFLRRSPVQNVAKPQDNLTATYRLFCEQDWGKESTGLDSLERSGHTTDLALRLAPQIPPMQMVSDPDDSILIESNVQQTTHEKFLQIRDPVPFV